MENWIFGIDGGGTASRLRIESPDGTLLYRGTAGSTNLNSNSAESVKEQLRLLFEGAYASGRVEKAGCAAGFLGSAGAGRPAEKAALARIVADYVPGTAKVRIGDDAEPALAGALGDIQGYILVAGTGSIALGRSASGELCRAGGWGHWLGDEGSAFWIAFEAIKRGIRASEGRAEPAVLGEAALSQAALEFFGMVGYQDLVALVYKNFDKAAIARFSRKVEELRANGNPAAALLFEQAASELAGLAASVYSRFQGKTPGRRIALCGGLLEGNIHLQELTISKLGVICPALEPVGAAGDAQAGACLLARSLL